MDIKTVMNSAFGMPISNPSYPRGPYQFFNREFFIITYKTDLAALQAVVPEPLEVLEPIVKYEFIRMPDSNGFGDYTESGQVIPVRYKGETGGYVHAMYLNDEAPIAGGREIWGFPKKFANPKLYVDGDTLTGTLDYNNMRIASATMGYKHVALDKTKIKTALSGANFLLKIIPHVDGSVRICELVRYYLQDIVIKDAWSGPGALHLIPHALAPVAQLPVHEVVSAVHIMTDVLLPYGEVVYDYLANRR